MTDYVKVLLFWLLLLVVLWLNDPTSFDRYFAAVEEGSVRMGGRR